MYSTMQLKMELLQIIKFLPTVRLFLKSINLTKPPHSALPTQHLILILMEVNNKTPRWTSLIHTFH